MSVMGQRLSISSMTTRFLSGRGSKKTGWKPSSVSCSPVELDSTALSSPIPCSHQNHTCHDQRSLKLGGQSQAGFVRARSQCTGYTFSARLKTRFPCWANKQQPLNTCTQDAGGQWRRSKRHEFRAKGSIEPIAFARLALKLKLTA